MIFQNFHFYSRKLSDHVEHRLSYLWIFLWPLGTTWSLRNRQYIKKVPKTIKRMRKIAALVSEVRVITRLILDPKFVPQRLRRI